MGEVGCACVIRSADTEVSEEELINYCRMNLARFKVPKLVLFVEEGDIPMTATGRVQKFKLADWAIEQLAHTQD
jgi:fatty-acyl-CoA synthase